MLLRKINLFYPSIILMIIFTLIGCSPSTTNLKKIKKRWNIPENKDLVITLVNGDVFLFQKGEYKVFKEKNVLKGLGAKPENKNNISKVVIPLAKIHKVEVTNTQITMYLVTAAVVTGLGVMVYFVTQD